MTDREEALFTAWVERFIRRILSDEAELGELDRLLGDGDFGANIASAVRKAAAELAEPPPRTAVSAFTALSRAFMGTGGTSGPLFGMWFREFARAFADGVDTRALSTAAANGLAAVQRLGHAEVGHKTMVDAMVPASDALADCAARELGVEDALLAAASEARRGAQSTIDMHAERGRATYVGDRSVGVADPGAVAVAIFFESGAELGATP